MSSYARGCAAHNLSWLRQQESGQANLPWQRPRFSLPHAASWLLRSHFANAHLWQSWSPSFTTFVVTGAASQDDAPSSCAQLTAICYHHWSALGINGPWAAYGPGTDSARAYSLFPIFVLSVSIIECVSRNLCFTRIDCALCFVGYDGHGQKCQNIASRCASMCHDSSDGLEQFLTTSDQLWILFCHGHLLLQGGAPRHIGR